MIQSYVGNTFAGNRAVGNGTFPYYPSPFSFFLTGPVAGTIYKPLVYTISLSIPYTGILIFSDSTNSGDFFPNFLSWNGTYKSQSFTYVPGTLGSRTITVTSNPFISISGNPLSISITPAVASSLVLTGPPQTDYLNAVALSVGIPSGNFTVTPNGLYTGIVNLSDRDAAQYSFIDNGTFNPTSLSFSNSNTSQTFTYTANSKGIRFISVSSTGLTSSARIRTLTQ